MYIFTEFVKFEQSRDRYHSRDFEKDDKKGNEISDLNWKRIYIIYLEGRASEIIFQSKDKARVTAAKGGQGREIALVFKER